MTTDSAQRLARVFVEISDTMVDEFDLVEFLQMLSTRVAGLVDATSAGVMLADVHGRLHFMAASDENTESVELFQMQHDEGPCLEAFRTGQHVTHADLADAGSRWPRFAARATQGGFRSVHAFPLRLRGEVIGTLNMFGTSAGVGLDDADTQVVQALADIAAIALLRERAVRRGELLADQLQTVLDSRIVVEQAKGIIAQAYQVSLDEAFTMMRRYAHGSRHLLGDVAGVIVTDLSSLPDFACR